MWTNSCLLQNWCNKWFTKDWSIQSSEQSPPRLADLADVRGLNIMQHTSQDIAFVFCALRMVIVYYWYKRKLSPKLSYLQPLPEFVFQSSNLVRISGKSAGPSESEVRKDLMTPGAVEIMPCEALQRAAFVMGEASARLAEGDVSSDNPGFLRCIDPYSDEFVR